MTFWLAKEDSMKEIGYWLNQATDPSSLGDPQFLFPDRYLQFVFLPHERARINKNNFSEEGRNWVRAMASELIHEFAGIPEAIRLVACLKTYFVEATKSTPYQIQMESLADHTAPSIRRVMVRSDFISQLFQEIYLRAQKSLKLEGFKRGQAPVSAIREHFKNDPPQDVMDSIANHFRNLADNSDSIEITCTLDALKENQELIFFVSTRSDLKAFDSAEFSFDLL